MKTFVLDGLVLLTEVKIVESTHLCYHEAISVVTTNCSRNGKELRHVLCKFRSAVIMAGRSKIFSSPIFWFLFGFSLCILACLSGKDAHIGLNMRHVKVNKQSWDNHWFLKPISPILYRLSIRHIGSVWKARVRFRNSRVNYYSNSDASFNLEYLQLCGDICPNPGPASPLFDALHVVRDNGK